MSSTHNSAFASNPAFLQKYLSLEQPEDQVQINYVWNDSFNDKTKAKSKTINFVPKSVEEVPEWVYCVGHTEPSGHYTTIEYVLKPVAMYRDPFRRGNNKMVWCETLTFDGEPTIFNTRASCKSAMDRVMTQHEPWFGIEQEYLLMKGGILNGRQAWPLGWPDDGFPRPGCFEYFYGVGPGSVIGRDICEAHYRACLYAGIPIAGENAEAVPAQWEFQVGPCTGVDAGDHLWMARHILRRVAEDAGIWVSLDAKTIEGWMGSGAHTNYSTKQSRDKDGGMDVINDMVSKLSLKHEAHMRVYDLSQGKDNERRLQGGIANSVFGQFTSGIGIRDVAVRIPRQCARDGCGYIEDRRPASNMDPYAVTEALVRTTLLNE